MGISCIKTTSEASLLAGSSMYGHDFSERQFTRSNISGLFEFALGLSIHFGHRITKNYE